MVIGLAAPIAGSIGNWLIKRDRFDKKCVIAGAIFYAAIAGCFCLTAADLPMFLILAFVLMLIGAPLGLILLFWPARLP